MTTPTEVVCSYTDHFEDESHVRAAVDEHSLRGLITAAVQVLDTLHCDDVTKAGLFIRDLCLGVLGSDISAEARSMLPSSGLFDGLASCLSAPNFSVRSQAVYTLGKLTFREYLPLLDRTFRERRDTDPLLMPRILFEASWLESQEGTHWARTQILAASPNPISRWAALAGIAEHFNSEPNAAVDDILTQSVRDSFRPIRTEAAYLRAEYNRRIANRYLSKEQFRSNGSRLKAERSAVEHLRPKLTFDVMDITFWKFHRHADYTTTDVLAFLDATNSDEVG